MNESAIVERTYGIVAENKVLGQNSILVWPIQKTPWMQGDLQSNLQSVTANAVDASGKSIQAMARTDTAIEAQWEAPDSNWATAPDVQRGESVELFRYADQNVYYWRERGNGAAMRRLETKRMLVSANKTAGTPDPSTHYMLEISGHTGAINLTTAKSNGELAAYTFTLNGKGGMASLSDDVGQEIVLDTSKKVIRLRNEEETMIELNEQDIAISALGSIGVLGKETIKFQCKNFQAVVDETFSVDASTSFSVTSPNIYLNGAMHFNGPIVQDSSAAGGYDVSLKGTVKTTADVQAGNISLTGHAHDGVERGTGTSNKPVGG